MNYRRKIKPQIKTDEHRYKYENKSAFIRVHLRLNFSADSEVNIFFISDFSVSSVVRF
jgi:hypothetical protein